MRRAIWIPLATLGLCALAQAAGAQRVHGTVRDSAVAAPLAGAVVSIVDSAGTVASRTIADGAGRFALDLPTATRAARVRVIRIGYRPRDIALPADLGVSLDVVMGRLPAMLETVRVSDNQLCPGSTDRGPAFQLWEQARAGLLAAVVAREAKPAMATSLVFKRQMSPGDGLIQHQQTHMSSGRTTRPFVPTAAPAVFAQIGYMQEDASGRTFSAPDADVLLDESFAATHCFQLQVADDAHRDQIGLAFTPVPERGRGRDTIVDVSGVIWMDRVVPALRSMDFRYTDLEPIAITARTGGHLEFRTMENGVSFIDWWVLRLPIMTPIRATIRSVRPEMAMPRRRQDRLDLTVAEIDEAGGVVLGATWGDGTKWLMLMSGVAGEVTQSGTGLPVVNAIVTIAGAADTVLTDARGSFTFTPLIPGRYTVSVTDTTLGNYAAARKSSRVIDVPRGRVVETRLQVSPLLATLHALCNGQKQPSHSTTLVGRVQLANGDPPRNASVRAAWQADYNNGSMIETVDGRSSGPVSISSAEQHSDVDDGGRFIVCGVALNRPIRLRLTRGDAFADTTVFAKDSTLSSIEWRLRRDF